MRRFTLRVLFVLLCVVVCITSVQIVQAEDLATDQYQREATVYDKTIYRAGERVTVYDLVNGDLYCFGNQIIIEGVINGDVICVGNDISVRGTVAHDVRVIGRNVTVSGTVGGNVSIVARNANLATRSAVTGDATIIATNVTLAGTIGRDATLRANRVIISGTVDRDVASYHASMAINPNAKLGTLSYSSSNQVTVPDGTVAGDVTPTTTNTPSFMRAFATGTVFLAVLLYIAWFVSLILTALGVAFLFPKSLEDSVHYAQRQPWISMLAGLLVLTFVPAIIMLLVVSVVGIPLAVIIGCLFLAVVLLSTPFIAHLFGTLLFPERSHPVRSLAGAVLLLLLLVIPLINVVVLLIATIFGTGLVVRVATQRYAVAASSYKALKVK